MRDILSPPPVEPAQAPLNISSTMTAFDSTGHMSKFVVEKPVVVIIEETWKNAYLKDSPAECLLRIRSPAIISVAPPIMPRYHLSSSFLTACLPCLIRIK